MDEQGSPRRMKTHLCIPRFKGNNTCTIKSSRLSPMTLVERFREAVFRVMMLSAISKTTSITGESGRPELRVKRSYRQADPHHSEAVADCIEFIKKSALTSEENRGSTASTRSLDATTEMVIPVPVM